MADPLSVTASIVAVIQLGSSVIGAIQDIKDAPKACKRIGLELEAIAHLLQALQITISSAIEEDQAWLGAVPLLEAENGPLKLLKTVLEELEGLVAPQGKGKGIRRAKILLWPLRKEDADRLLSVIERQKQMITLALTNDHVALSKAIKQDTTCIKKHAIDLREQAARSNTRQEAADRAQKLENAVNDLSAVDYAVTHKRIRDERIVDSAEWLLTEDVFRDWRDGVTEILWCSGLPGAGKTFMASTIIDHLTARFAGVTVAVTYQYFGHDLQAEQSLQSSMRNITRQLLQANPDLLDEVVAPNGSISFSSVASVASLGRNFANIFLVVDALDEYSADYHHRCEFIDALLKLQSAIGQDTCRLCIISRPAEDVWTRLQDSGRTAHRIDLKASKDDISAYLALQLRECAAFQGWSRRDDKLGKLVVDTIIEKSDRIFKLAALQVTKVLRQLTLGAAKRTLHNLSGELQDYYSEAFDRIRARPIEQRDTVLNLFAWLACAEASMDTPALLHALAINDSVQSYRELSDFLPNIASVAGMSEGLVVVHGNPQFQDRLEVRFAHETVRAFVGMYGHDLLGNTHIYIAKQCLNYLSLPECMSIVPGYYANYLGELRKSRAFLDFAAGRWVSYFRDSVVAQSLCQELDHFEAEFSRHIAQQPYATGLLHIYAAMDCRHLFRSRIDRGLETLALDGRLRSPLHYACAGGSHDIVEQIFELTESTCEHPLAAVDCDAPDSTGQTPLLLAVQDGHSRVVEVIMRSKTTDLHARDRQGKTAVHLASNYGLKTILETLLSRENIDVNARALDGTTALHLAVSGYQDQCVRVLLAHPAVDVNVVDGAGYTPLHRAISISDLVIVELLLSHKRIDVFMPNVEGTTALQLAALQKKKSIVQILLRHQDINLCLDNQAFEGLELLEMLAIMGLGGPAPLQDEEAWACVDD